MAKFEFSFVDVYEVFIPSMEFPLNETFHSEKFNLLKSQSIENVKNFVKKKYDEINLKLNELTKTNHLNLILKELNLINNQFDSFNLIGEELSNNINIDDIYNDYIDDDDDDNDNDVKKDDKKDKSNDSIDFKSLNDYIRYLLFHFCIKFIL